MLHRVPLLSAFFFACVLFITHTLSATLFYDKNDSMLFPGLNATLSCASPDPTVVGMNQTLSTTATMQSLVAFATSIQKQRSTTVRKARQKKLSPRTRRLRRNTKRTSMRNIPRSLGLIRTMTIIYDTLLVPGVIYRKLDVELADSAHALVHAVTCVVRNPRYGIELIQARERIGELESLPSLVRRLDSTQGKAVLAAVNGSFWRSGTFLPIGTSVCDGEVVAVTNSSWYTFWLDKKWRPWLDTGILHGSICCVSDSSYTIDAFNTASSGLQLFNRFAGDSIPILPNRKPSTQLTTQNVITGDTLDPQWTTDSLTPVSYTHLRGWHQELQSAKVLLRYLRQPLINQPTPCVVLETHDSGRVEIPLRGCILAFPTNHPLYRALVSGKLKRGDTVTLHVRSPYRDTLPFHTAISGTPLLLTNGQVKPQLEDTTRRASPFVEQRLARTAIGTDVIQSVLYMVAVEKTSGKSVGMTLRELAQFMKKFGASDALNLDGGSSTTMVIGNRCVVPVKCTDECRAIANALVIWKRRVQTR